MRFFNLYLEEKKVEEEKEKAIKEAIKYSPEYDIGRERSMSMFVFKNSNFAWELDRS